MPFETELLFTVTVIAMMPVSDTATPAGQSGANLASDDLFGDFISTPAVGAASETVPQGTETTPGSDLFAEGAAGAEAEPKKSTKESIMALYGSSAASQQQMFGVPGV